MGGKLTTLHDKSVLKPKSALAVENVDLKKLKRLILTRRLAPFWDPSEQEHAGNEECPICNNWYPSMNTASCCTAPLCTECFVSCQTSSEPPGKATCPFCKHSPFCVRYSGGKSVQHIKEQGRRRIIATEAKLRRLRARVSNAAQRMQQQRALRTAAASNTDHSQRQQVDQTSTRLRGVTALPTGNSLQRSTSDNGYAHVSEARSLQLQQQHRHSIAVLSRTRSQPQAQPQQQQSLLTGTTGLQRSVSQHGAHEQRDVQPHLDQHLQQQQPVGAEEVIPDVLFEAALLPLYLRDELGGLQLDELEEILVEQALLASMQQAATPSTASADQSQQTQLAGPHPTAAAATATCQGSGQLTQEQDLATAAAAAAALDGVRLVPPPQQQERGIMKQYAWLSYLTPSQFAAVVTAYSLFGNNPRAVVPLSMVTSIGNSGAAEACSQQQQQAEGDSKTETQRDIVSFDQGGVPAGHERAVQNWLSSQLPTDRGDEVEGAAGCQHTSPQAPDAFETDVQGCVLSAPALLTALEGGSSPATAGSAGASGINLVVNMFSSLSTEQQQQAAVAAMATSLALVQNPDGSVLLLTDMPDRITPAAAAAVAAAAVAPASELSDDSDAALQRHLAAVDARLAVAVAARQSSSSQGRVAPAAAARSGAAGHEGTVGDDDDDDASLQQRLAAEDAQFASRLAAVCMRSQQHLQQSSTQAAAAADADPDSVGTCSAAVVSSDGTSESLRKSNPSSSSTAGRSMLRGHTGQAAADVATAADVAAAAGTSEQVSSTAVSAPDSDDLSFAERLRQRDEAYAAALMARLTRRQ